MGNLRITEVYCNSTYDGYLCWPPTLGGHLSVQHCPDVRLSDATQFAFRRCGLDGKWAGRHANDTNPNGWTNYTPCFPPVVQSLFYKVYNEDDSHAQTKFDIANITRKIEIVGFTISFVALTISLMILYKFKALNNMRTWIHKNFFLAMTAQVVVYLIVYIDQAITGRGEGTDSHTSIENYPYLCVASYILLEYFISVSFNWMIGEGIYLNYVVTHKALRDNNYLKWFLIFGWVVPIFTTAAWAIATAVHYGQSDGILGCWYGYSFLPQYWILQAPRFLVLLINAGFLLNIMRVLVMKLWADKTSEIVKIRKALKAAMILLPLLGMTNIFSMFEGPVAGTVLQFATWSYTTHFLRSFQGFFVAWMYCIGTSEVHVVLRQANSTHRAIFLHRHPILARCLGLRRKRRLQRFPRSIPQNPSNENMTRPETLALTMLSPRMDLNETEFMEPQHQRYSQDFIVQIHEHNAEPRDVCQLCMLQMDKYLPPPAQPGTSQRPYIIQ